MNANFTKLASITHETEIFTALKVPRYWPLVHLVTLVAAM